jgi:competence protein ComEC
MPLGEAVTQAETLHQPWWVAAASRAAATLRAIPTHIATGWHADALRRGLFAPALAGAGIAIYFALGTEPPLTSALIVVPAVVGWLIVARGGSDGATTVFACIAAVAAGFSLAVVRTSTLATVTVAAETRMLTISARVERSEPADKGRTRLWLSVFKTEPSLRAMPKRVRVSVTKLTERLGPGDWIEVRARLAPLPPPVAPGAYDFGRKLWFDGIGAVGFSLAPVKRISPPREPTTIEAAFDGINAFRRRVSERIVAGMSPQAGAIGAAFLTGERGLISEEDNEAMRDSSLAHLLSISGLHMALAGFGFFAALRLFFALTPPIALNYPVKKWAAAAALVASFGYLLLSGASVPTQRSFIMVAVALIAIIFDRSALTMRTVAIAAAIVLIFAPESWMDPSFQMSFAAVVALIAAYEWWNARRIPDAEAPSLIVRAGRLIAAAAVTSLIAGLATTPFAAFHFNRFADYGVAANVIVTPIVSFIIMPAGVLALLLMPLGLEAAPLAVMGEGIEAMLAVAHWVASWPGATQAVAAWPIEALAVIVAGGLWLAIWQASWRWLGVLPIALGLALTFTTTLPDVLITGDGDNVAIRGADGQLRFLSSRRGRFDAEMWLRRDGDARDVAEAVKARDGGFVCDAAGCIGQMGGRKDRVLAIAWGGEAAVEDCMRASVFVDLGRGWRPACSEPALSVSRKMLSAEGAISARLSGEEIVWTSVARERGRRPWAQ